MERQMLEWIDKRFFALGKEYRVRNGQYDWSMHEWYGEAMAEIAGMEGETWVDKDDLGGVETAIIAYMRGQLRQLANLLERMYGDLSAGSSRKYIDTGYPVEGDNEDRWNIEYITLGGGKVVWRRVAPKTNTVFRGGLWNVSDYYSMLQEAQFNYIDERDRVLREREAAKLLAALGHVDRGGAS